MFSLELPASKCHPGPPHGYFHVKLGNKQSIGTSHRTKSIHPLVGLRRYIATPENLPETADLKMVESLEISKRVQWTHLFGLFSSTAQPRKSRHGSTARVAWAADHQRIWHCWRAQVHGFKSPLSAGYTTKRSKVAQPSLHTCHLQCVLRQTTPSLSSLFHDSGAQCYQPPIHLIAAITKKNKKTSGATCPKPSY